MSPTILLTAALAIGGAEAEQAAQPAAKGKWLIVYAEEGGKRNNAWEQKVATFDGKNLTYKADGKERSVHLSFGPRQTVKATMAGGSDGEQGSKKKSFTGVYIAAQDYVCISLKHGKGRKKAEADEEKGHSSGDFILILRRQRKG